MNAKPSVLLRLISTLTLAAFVSSEALYAAQAGVVPMRGAAEPPVTAARLAADPTLIDIPFEAATLKEVHQGTNGKLIVHIQDAHSNLGGQENLARTIEHFITKYKIGLVLVEGADRDASLDDVRESAPLDEWKLAAKRFLFDGMISGEEYLNLTTRLPMKIVGIEQRYLYDRNLEAYAGLVERRKRILAYVRDIKNSLERAKNRTYPEELLGYENKKSRESLGDFATDLEALFAIAAKAGVTLDTSFPETRRLEEVRSFEKQIDFRKAGLEQEDLLAALSSKSAALIRAFVETAAKTKKSEIAQSMALAGLLRTARENAIDTAAYPEFVRYAEYLGRFTELRMDALLSELEALEQAAYAKLLDTDAAKKLRAIDRYLGLLDRAYAIQMSSKDFEAYLANAADFPTPGWQAFLNRRLVELGAVEDIVPYSADFEEADASLREFYELVNRRDDAFLENARRVMDDLKSDAAFLVAGGYHTAHLTTLLRNEGYSYVVLAPLVTSETDRGLYEKVLLGSIQKKSRSVVMGSSDIRALYARGNARFEAYASNARLASLGSRILNAPAVDTAGAADIARPSLQETGARPAAQAQSPDSRRSAGSRSVIRNIVTMVAVFLDRNARAFMTVAEQASVGNMEWGISLTVVFWAVAHLSGGFLRANNVADSQLAPSDTAGARAGVTGMLAWLGNHIARVAISLRRGISRPENVEPEEPIVVGVPVEEPVQIATKEQQVVIAETAIRKRIAEVVARGNLPAAFLKARIEKIGEGGYAMAFAVSVTDQSGRKHYANQVYKYTWKHESMRAYFHDNTSEEEFSKELRRFGHVAARTRVVSRYLKGIPGVAAVAVLTEQERGVPLDAAFNFAVMQKNWGRVESILRAQFELYRALHSQGVFVRDASTGNALLVQRFVGPQGMPKVPQLYAVLNDFHQAYKFSTEGNMRTAVSHEGEPIDILSTENSVDFLMYYLYFFITNTDPASGQDVRVVWAAFERLAVEYGMGELVNFIRHPQWSEMASRLLSLRERQVQDYSNEETRRDIEKLFRDFEAGGASLQRLREEIVEPFRLQATYNDRVRDAMGWPPSGTGQIKFPSPKGFAGVLNEFRSDFNRAGLQLVVGVPAVPNGPAPGARIVPDAAQGQVSVSPAGTRGAAARILPSGQSFGSLGNLSTTVLAANPFLLQMAAGASSTRAGPFALELPRANSYIVAQIGPGGLEVRSEAGQTAGFGSGSFGPLFDTARVQMQRESASTEIAGAAIDVDGLILDDHLRRLGPDARLAVRNLRALIAEGRTPGGVVVYLDDWVGDASKGTGDATYLSSLAQARKVFKLFAELGFKIQIAGSESLVEFAATEGGLGEYRNPLPPGTRVTHMGSEETLRAADLGQNRAVLPTLKPDPGPGSFDFLDILGNLFVAVGLSMMRAGETPDSKLVRFIATRKGVTFEDAANIPGTLTDLATGSTDSGVMARALRYVALPKILAVKVADFVRFMEKMGRAVLEAA